MEVSAAVESAPCPGCGAAVPLVEGPTHPYIGAPAGCWAAYMEVIARDFGEYRYPRAHRLAVDTYAVQHPGRPGRRSRQSVAVHLIALYLALERAFPPEAATRVMRLALREKERYPWLEPPFPRGELTVLDVLAAKGLDEHARAVERWARSVWEAWAPHRGTVEAWTLPLLERADAGGR